MTRVLLVNHSQENCGVKQFGKRFANLASRSKTVEVNYFETDSLPEFRAKVGEVNPTDIIYNWYPCTMPWLGEDQITKYPQYKHWFIFHDGNVRKNYDGYLFSGAGEKDSWALRIDLNRAHILPRPLFDYKNNYPSNEVVTVGSFGLGGWQKGFPDLVTLVGKSFDRAVLNMQIAPAYFGDPSGTDAKKIAALCHELNVYPNLELNISHVFLSDAEMLDFLAKNDINAFLYRANSEGLSSVTDFALSVDRPIAVVEGMMFRHLDTTLIDTGSNTLQEILDRGIAPLAEHKKKWSTDNFVKEFNLIFEDK